MLCVHANNHLCLKVAAELGDKVKVLKIDVDENQELSSQLRVCWNLSVAPPPPPARAI